MMFCFAKMPACLIALQKHVINSNVLYDFTHDNIAFSFKISKPGFVCKIYVKFDIKHLDDIFYRTFRAFRLIPKRLSILRLFIFIRFCSRLGNTSPQMFFLCKFFFNMF